MQKKIKIAHLTSAHTDTDIRIFHKECKSLFKAGYEVVEVTLSGNPRVEDNIPILSAEFQPSSRWNRMRNASKKIVDLAKQVDADIYHFHDPELLKVGLKLKRLGKTVIYDTHEDTPRQILSKPYLNKPLRYLICKAFELYENSISKRLDAIVAATPHIAERFIKVNPNTHTICNFPLYAEIETTPVHSTLKQEEKRLCYIGGITKIRGIKEMIDATAECKIPLDIAGKWDGNLQDEMAKLPGWENVNNLGFLPRTELIELKRDALAGLVLLLPEPNHIFAYPIKMFEYMAGGLPVIASNFEMWKDIIEKENVGLCVDPFNPKEVAAAAEFIRDNPDEAAKMSENGRRLILEKYNWQIEEQKLLSLYEQLIN